MRKNVLIAVLAIVLVVAVTACVAQPPTPPHDHFGETWTGSALYGLKVNNTGGTAIYGLASYHPGETYGVFGQSDSDTGRGVYGLTSSSTGTNYGVYGETNSPNGWGLYTPDRLYVGANAEVYGDLDVLGTKNFVQVHPADSAKEIVYVSFEGPEAGTYMRGTAQLINGEAIINLPEHFSIVTSDEGLTVQLTPFDEWLQLYVVQKSAKQIIVREANSKNGRFDYLLQGVRKGYENHQVIRTRNKN